MRRRFFLLLSSASLCAPGVLIAQAQRAADRAAPEAYTQALALLEKQDTLGALAKLRAATKAAPKFGPAFLRLGSVLSARAGEAELVFGERREAERALEQALKLLGDEPEVLLEWGLLLRKQNVRVDARRVLERAWAAAHRKGEEMAPRERARLHYALGKIYEVWWEDWQNLVMMPPAAQQLLHCSALGGPAPPAIAASYCPKQWAEVAEHVVVLADRKAEERERMLQHFWLAFEADPTHVEAGAALLGHLSDAGEWEDYEVVARDLVAASPENARAYLFLGLGLHERGKDAAADSAFTAALALLTAPERAVFADIARILPRRLHSEYAALDSAGKAATAEVLFAGKDPLFLTAAQERRLEHYARIAWAELKFAAPFSGLRGWETERGDIWIRYGQPWKWFQCCYGETVRNAYWSYGPEGPVFVFTRGLVSRRARMQEPSKFLADDLAGTNPELYRPKTIAAVYDLPHQYARFRGSQPDLVRIELYAAPPIDSLGVEPGDRLEAGVFLFERDYHPLWERRHEVAVAAEPIGLTYRAEAAAGEYRYALEIRELDADSVVRPVARARASLAVRAFPLGELALSDLLLANAISATTANPTRRDELRIAANRTTTFERGSAVHLYFEIYGLRVSADSLARYRAELAVEDSTQRNVARRLLRGAAELVRGGGEEPRVSWERTARPEHDVAPDYLTIELPELGVGEYVVRLRITDLTSARTAETVKRFRVEAPRGGR